MAAGKLFGSRCVYAEEIPRQSGHARILLVDDDRLVTTALKLGLEAEGGFRVDTFNNPEQALSQYRTGYYDLIILDIRMNHMDGFQLARKIWQIDEDAKICFLTAYAVYESQAKKIFPSIRDYCFIQKPISIDGLVRVINQRLYLRE